MDNGDIIAGSSDAIIRVFSKDPSRIAPNDSLAAYDTAVNTRKLEQTKTLGTVKVTDLPGPESLLQEGTEGQTRMVRQPNGKINCYQWTNGSWQNLGDVVGAADEGKTLYEGCEYDFVFNVDIEDGKPPLKLPFNKGDDPWMAAQKFIYKHDLPQVYLDQVANFIITNAKVTSSAPTNPEFADPFTGGGRYVPTFDSIPPHNQTPSNVNVNFRESRNGSSVSNADPFTGSDSYTSSSSEFLVKKHIPHSVMTSFDGYDGVKILAKLKEFNSQIEDDSARATEEELTKSVDLMAAKNTQDVSCLTKLMKWPKEKLFPVLDVIRLAIRNENFCLLMEGSVLMDYLIQRLNTTAANQLMIIRALSNMLLHELGKNLVNFKLNDICNMISAITQGTGNLQNALASFFLNQSIVQMEMKSDDACVILAIGAVRISEWINDPEAIFRLYQALGNLVTFNSQAVFSIIKAADNLKSSLKKNQSAPLQKLVEISTELADKLI